MITHRTSLATACALALMMAAPAAAQKSPSKEDKKTASVRFKKAVELYKAGDVRAALIEFRRAYKLAPTYHLLFNIGQASAELRDYVDAYNSFTQYLADGGDKISDKRREMVERELERLKGYLARLDVSVSVDGAEITIDGVEAGVSPLEEPLLVSAGRRKVVVNREGYASWERSVDLAGEDETTLKVQLISLNINGQKSGDKTRRLNLGTKFWISGGLTVAFGIGSGVVGAMTLGAQRQADEILSTVPTTQQEIDQAIGKTKRLALITDIGLGLTVAAGVATLVFALRGGGEEKVPAGEQQSVNVVVSPNSVALIGRF